MSIKIETVNTGQNIGLYRLIRDFMPIDPHSITRTLDKDFLNETSKWLRTKYPQKLYVKDTKQHSKLRKLETFEHS